MSKSKQGAAVYKPLTNFRFSIFDSVLVPKLCLGMPLSSQLCCASPFRNDYPREKQSFWDKCVPKLSLGTRRGEAPPATACLIALRRWQLFEAENCFAFLHQIEPIARHCL